jgi:hypothetical protein
MRHDNAFVNEIPLTEKDLFVAQFYASKNDLAVELTQETVIDICAGLMDPNSDNDDQIIMRFGTSCMNKEGVDIMIYDKDIH